MALCEERIEGLSIAYIGGGSRLWARTLMNDLALEGSLSGVVRLYDIDVEAAGLNARIGNRFSEHPEAKGRWFYEVAPTLRDALTGTDFVVLSITPGTFQEMASDVHEPERYGIYQAVGDTTGPGGLMRALRAIPIYAEFAEAIKTHCPAAWVINYTNPMAICTRTLYEVFPEIKAFGCCHEVFGAQRLLAQMLADMEGIQDVPRHEIRVNVLGINHFAWIDKASYRTLDLMPIYKRFVDEYYESGFGYEEEARWLVQYFVSARRVQFDLFRRYGIIAAAGDRHVVEFMPGLWYLRNPDTVRQWRFGLTPVSWRIDNMKKKAEASRRLAAGTDPIQFWDTGEEGVQQMKALLGLGDLVTNVNLPHRGQMEDIPAGAVVETNALFTRDSIHPVVAGRLPDPVHNLVVRHVLNHGAILQAGLKRDKSLAFSAFVNDPLVTIGLPEAEALFEQMLKNTANYLPGWNIAQ